MRSEAQRSPRDPLVLYYLGTQAYNNGSLAEALSSFERAVAIDPKMARAYSGIALVRQRLSQIPEAYAAAKRAAELDPKSVDAQYTLAMLTTRGSVIAAAGEFRKLTRMAPKRADAWHWLGLSLVQAKQTNDALEPLEKAVALEASNAIYQRDLGRLYLDLHRFDDARKTLNRSLTLEPNDPEALYHRGRLAILAPIAEGEIREASVYYERALKLLQAQEKPDSLALSNIYNGLAEAHTRLKQPEKALPLLLKSRQANPKRSDTLYELAGVYRALNRGAEAATLLKEYDRRRSIETAIFQLTERIKQDLKNPRLRLEMARLYRRGGDLPRSENQYQVLLGMEPKNAAALAELKSVRQEMKRRRIPSLMIGN